MKFGDAIAHMLDGGTVLAHDSYQWRLRTRVQYDNTKSSHTAETRRYDSDVWVISDFRIGDVLGEWYKYGPVKSQWIFRKRGNKEWSMVDGRASTVDEACRFVFTKEYVMSHVHELNHFEKTYEFKKLED
jgi:hypothetical protein